MSVRESVKEKALLFGVGTVAGVGLVCAGFPGAAVAAGAAAAAVVDFTFAAGGVTGMLAAAFAVAHFGGLAPEAPAAPEPAAPATTLTAEGNCKQIETKLTGEDGQRVELVLPAGCVLKP